MEKGIIIYGAYGYTGRLIALEAKKKKVKVLLAGRSESKLAQLANELKLPFVVADIHHLDKLDSYLNDYAVIVNAAGPFIETVDDIISYCLRHGLHYTDITGEVEVFEKAKSYDGLAKEKGMMLMPGTGFDVVPSDCLAKYLSELLPDANTLELAFRGTGASSHGTNLTVIQGLGQGGAIRREGQIVTVPYAYEVKKFDFDHPRMSAVTIPWGDISTAYHSTGIPNIKVFMSMPPNLIQWMKILNYLKPLVRNAWIQNLLKSIVKPGGPSDVEREKSRSYLVGEVRNSEGISKRAQIDTVDGYTLTLQTAVLIAQKILKGQFTPGFQTPSSAYGYKLVLEVENTKLKDIA